MRKNLKELDEKIAMRLLAARKAAGVKQKELAAMMGLSFQQIQKYEQGVNRLSAGRLHRACCALGLPYSYFFEDAEDAPEPDNPLYNEKSLAFLKAYNQLPDKTQQALEALMPLLNKQGEKTS